MSFQQTRRAAGTFEGAPGQVAVAQEVVPVRLAFLRKVYSLFGAAIAVWMGTAAVIASNDAWSQSILGLFSGNPLGLLVLIFGGMFLLRATAKSFPMNLVGLGIFAVMYGAWTGPIVWAYAQAFGGYLIVAKAFILTLSVFGGLTGYVLLTKRDFSFMRGGLMIAGGLAFGMIILSVFFGVAETFVSSTGFAAAMVLLMAGFTLYDTSNIVRHYPSNMAATAAATIFADFVLMFLWILRALGGNRD